MILEGNSLLIFTGELDIAFLFVREEPLVWEVRLFSYWFGTRYGISSLALLIALPLAQRAGAGDHLVCSIGIISKIAALLLFAFSTNTAMAFSGVFCQAYSYLFLRTFQTLFIF
jgi:hypothetical protein